MNERRRATGLLTPVLWIGLAAQAAANTYGDWVLRDWPGLGCGIETVVHGRATGVSLVEVVLLPADEGADLLMRVPTGAQLVDGVAYRQGSDVVGLHWQNCSPTRCTAHVRIGDHEVARLKAGREIIVGYRPTADAPALNVPVSLAGVTRGIAAVETCRAAKRGG
jgi:invasion protein IalB